MTQNNAMTDQATRDATTDAQPGPAVAGQVERRVMLEKTMSIFIGGSLDGKAVDTKIKADFKYRDETYFVREYWKRDGIGGTVHSLKFWVSSNISAKDAVFKIEQYLRHNAELTGRGPES